MLFSVLRLSGVGGFNPLSGASQPSKFVLTLRKNSQNKSKIHCWPPQIEYWLFLFVSNPFEVSFDDVHIIFELLYYIWATNDKCKNVKFCIYIQYKVRGLQGTGATRYRGGIQGRKVEFNCRWKGCKIPAFLSYSELVGIRKNTWLPKTCSNIPMDRQLPKHDFLEMEEMLWLTQKCQIFRTYDPKCNYGYMENLHAPHIYIYI